MIVVVILVTQNYTFCIGFLHVSPFTLRNIVVSKEVVVPVTFESGEP
jgi:hypothetical protein